VSTLEAVWAQPVTQALAVALARFVWQGAAVALGVRALLFCMARRPARERYALACLGLLVMAVLPVASFISELAAEASGVTTVSTLQGENTLTGSLEITLATWVHAWLGTLRPWLMSAWLCGVLFLLLRTALAWRQALSLTREGTRQPGSGAVSALARMMARTGVRRPVRLLESAAIEVPTVVGLWRPLILVPTSTLTGLSVWQLEAVLAHELAHIRRHDYLVNLLQALVEAALFYHPAVWWLSAHIREEREHCADDVAVESCGSALLYSRTLATLEHLRVSPPAPAVAVNGGALLPRIQRLLSRHPGGAPLHPWRLAGSLAVAMLVVVLGAARQAQATGATSEPPAPPVQADTPAPPEVCVEPDTLPFGAGMTRPEKISGPVPQYTKEALEKRSQGLMIVKCIITSEGEVRRCRIIQPLPFMEEAVLDALYQSRYKPVTFEGRPVQIDYTFNIKLTLPSPAREN
jgi:TonB family protein